jgi:hypothetical protein
LQRREITKLINPFIDDGEFETKRKVLGKVNLIPKFMRIVDLVLHVDLCLRSWSFGNLAAIVFEVGVRVEGKEREVTDCVSLS